MKWLTLVVVLVVASALAATPQEGRDKDGHYRDPLTGAVQPDRCDNSFKNTHPCRCSRTKECDPKHQKDHPSVECQTYCRTDACSCVSECGS
jgi:hypothetical protein